MSIEKRELIYLFSIDNVIAEHNSVVALHDAVWFGKIGTPIAKIHLDKINAQIEKGEDANLYLIKGNRKKLTFYTAKIITVSNKLPENETQLIPKYYFSSNILGYMSFWAKILSITEISQTDMNQLKVVGSAFDIMESVTQSTSGHFIVKKILQS